MSRIDVFYGRTDNTTGYKEYGCVVVETADDMIQYYDDVYEPRDCSYKVLYEVSGRQLQALIEQEPACEPLHIVGWVTSPLKDRVLAAWKESK